VNTADTPLGEWLVRLESLSPREIELGLERVELLLSRLAIDPPRRVFHVGGTNGKGSCVAMLEALLRQAGARVGCYTSPHIHRYNERIRIDGVDASDESIIAAFAQIEAVRDGVPLTYFEYGTLAALVVVAAAGVDCAVLEVGMGGRLDAVNAIEPDAVLISNVTLDHCDYLGHDVETIAFEKAGIMRAGKPAVFGCREVPAAIFEQAERIGASLIVAGRDYDWSPRGSHWDWRGARTHLTGLARPSLEGEHQLENAAAVLALLEAADYGALLEVSCIDAAFSRLQVPGRMQRIGGQPRWVFDVAHNPAAAIVLARTLRAELGPGRTIAVLGMLDDKDVAGVVTALRNRVDTWIAVTAHSARAIQAGELARQVANLTNSACLVAESMPDAIGQARHLAGPDDRILVTGSFYVVGPALELLRTAA
jgi:dihydrofolate synthase / folylpolyglutamate synthase